MERKLIIELKDELKLLVNGSEEDHVWQKLAGEHDLLRRALQEAVDSAADTGALLTVPLTACWALLTDPRFKASVAGYYRRHRLPGIDVERLVRNAQALAATARAAVIARQLSYSSRTATVQMLHQWAREAALRLRAAADACSPGAAEEQLRLHEPNSSADFVDGVYRQLAEQGLNSTAARYWTLSWLRQQTSLERHKREVPVAAAYTRGGNGHLAWVELIRVLEGLAPELVEHPQMALLPLGQTLLEGVARAWKSAGAGTACWHLKTPWIAQDGNSLSGAMAVGFHSIFTPETYLSTCLIIARLGQDGQSLYSAGFESEKLTKAYQDGMIRHAVLGGLKDESGRQPGESAPRVDNLAALRELGLRVTTADTVFEARGLAAGRYGVGTRYLGRYETTKPLRSANDEEDERSRTWIGVEDNNQYLIKVWHYDDPRLKDFIRAWWDGELRTMYRLCSSPGAEKSLLLIRDAGLDHENQAYVMVLEGGGYETLDKTLRDRPLHPWLKRDNLVQKDARGALWAGLRQIAAGIQLLHSQHVIHGKLSAESIYLNPATGPESWRLGGFEWSVRLDSLPSLRQDRDRRKANWWRPPNSDGEGGLDYTFDADWYAFGMLCARCFYLVENLAQLPPDELNQRVLRVIAESPEPLAETERTLICRLIAARVKDRPYPHDSILDSIDQVIQHLETGAVRDEDARPLVVAFNPLKVKGEFYDAVEAAGFVADVKDPKVRFSAVNEDHVGALEDFLSEHFEGALIYPLPLRNNSYLLAGRHFNLQIVQYGGDGLGRAEPTWDVAAADGVKELRGAKDRPNSLSGKIRFVASANVTPGLIFRSWNRYLPRPDHEKNLHLDLERLREFLRCTNQIELLFRYAEIYPYRRVEGPWKEDNFEWILVEEDKSNGHDSPTKTSMPKGCRPEGGMTEFLHRERERSKCKVLLTERSDMLLPLRDKEGWEIQRIVVHASGRRVLLKRRFIADDRPPASGYLRTSGLHGQLMLVERRKKAIERLQEHSYLLRALAQPGLVFIDTKQEKLPYQLPEKLVESKQPFITDILRTRPIYSLQGPPGTGKSTLVAHLLREILTEDPVAQILVTAQAHGAVDVLREKVSDEAYHGEPKEKKPLAVRLGRRTDNDDETRTLEGTVEQEALELLEHIRKKTEAEPLDSGIRDSWKALVAKMLAAANSQTKDGSLAEFEQLVKRGANIIYCTTSARDLEILAEDNQSFDWTVVEEAGKVHGCDLALPLQAGHRWLLLGDQYQLEPYRYGDFKAAIGDLERCIKVLGELSGRDRLRLVDTDWLNGWRDRNEKERKDFIDYAQDWLNSFARIFNTLSDEVHGSGGKLTKGKSVGAAAGELDAQYRMHPSIGKLVSQTFYGGRVKDMTVDDGKPLGHVRHPLRLLDPPAAPDGTTLDIAGKAVVWIDVPPTRDYWESGPERGKLRYSNEHEAYSIIQFLEGVECAAPPEKELEVAILSPYKEQVMLLEQALKGVRLPKGLKFRESLSGKRHSQSTLAHTVDSFQGNQADVVLISLVRNNKKDPQKGLGFLDHPNRLNVLISRAERLLVLVGSWEFFYRQLKRVRSTNVESPLKHWRDLLDSLEREFNENMAVRLPPYKKPPNGYARLRR